MLNLKWRHSVDSVVFVFVFVIVMALVRSVKCPLNRYCAVVAIELVVSYAMQWLDHYSIVVSIDLNRLNHDRKRVSSFDHWQPDDGLEWVADVNTEVPTNLVCYRLIRNVTNCPYFQSMFHLMNWNVQQIDWFE